MGHFLIIAGSSDIGFATARRLLSQGHQVTMTSRDENKRDMASTIGAQFYAVNPADFKSLLTLFETIYQRDQALDGVVNCAGSILLKPAHLINEVDFQEIIDTNLKTAFATVHAAGKVMAKCGGSVVLIASAAALIGLPNHEAIAAAKAGVIGLALSAAATYAHFNLRFNVVAPGLVETKLTQSMTANPASKISESMHPLNRIGSANDIASAICFLLQLENSWITGEVLTVDGGLSHIKSKVKA